MREEGVKNEILEFCRIVGKADYDILLLHFSF